MAFRKCRPDQMRAWKQEYEGVENMTLAVMGCVVNGPGESKAASIGISLPGTGEEPHCPVYIDGQHFTTLKGTYEELSTAFRALVDDIYARMTARSATQAPARDGAFPGMGISMVLNHISTNTLAGMMEAFNTEPPAHHHHSGSSRRLPAKLCLEDEHR